MTNVPVSAKVVVSSVDSGKEVRFAASTSADMSSPIFSASVMPDAFKVARSVITGLAAGTKYFLGMSIDEAPVFSLGAQFHTGGAGAHSFSFCAASCIRNTSNAHSFDRIRDRAEADDVEFFICTGDLHYRDIVVNDEALFQSAYDEVTEEPRPRNMWRSLPVLYMWDDHDYGPDNSDMDSPSREAAIKAYRNRVPHTPLAKAGETDAPYFSWVRGRVRFVFADLRSERVPNNTFDTNNENQKMLSDEQRDWLLDEFDAAETAGQAVIWISSVPWVDETGSGDSWGGFNANRMTIADHITNNSLDDRIAVLAGDMHALAYDNGTSVNNPAGLHVMQAAAIDQSGSEKGGPYSTGPVRSPAEGNVTQYGLFDITDTGGATLNVRFRGFSVNQDTGVETEEFDVNFDLDADTPA